jgi:hypothetical protein
MLDKLWDFIHQIVGDFKAIFRMSRCKLRTPWPIHFKLHTVIGIDSLTVCILFGEISIFHSKKSTCPTQSFSCPKIIIINSCAKSAWYAHRQHSYNICKDFLSHNSWMKNWNFTKKYTDRKTINSNNCAKLEFLCLCELSLSRFVDLYHLINYFYYWNQPIASLRTTN